MPDIATHSFVKTSILQHEKEAGERLSKHEKREQDLRHDLRTDITKVINCQDEKIDKLHDESIIYNETIVYMKDFMREMKEEVKEIKMNQDGILRKVSYVGGAIAVIAGLGSFAAQIFF